LGVRRLDIDGRELWGHTGTITGYCAVTVYSPADGYVITILSNPSTVDLMPLAAQLQADILR